jgi:hypothetical protein
MIKRLAYPGALGLLLVSLVSCGASANPSLGFALRDRLRGVPGFSWLSPVTPIAEVDQHRQGTTYLEGQVGQLLPLIDQSLYQLTDPSGAIWVVTTAPPPTLGEQVTIRATIHYESILMRGQDIGEHYAEELERMVKE